MLRVERSFLFNYHDHVGGQIKEEIFMAFFNSVVTVLQTLVIALGAGLGIWERQTKVLSLPPIMGERR